MLAGHTRISLLQRLAGRRFVSVMDRPSVLAGDERNVRRQGVRRWDLVGTRRRWCRMDGEGLLMPV